MVESLGRKPQLRGDAWISFPGEFVIAGRCGLERIYETPEGIGIAEKGGAFGGFGMRAGILMLVEEREVTIHPGDLSARRILAHELLERGLELLAVFGIDIGVLDYLHGSLGIPDDVIAERNGISECGIAMAERRRAIGTHREYGYRDDDACQHDGARKHVFALYLLCGNHEKIIP